MDMCGWKLFFSGVNITTRAQLGVGVLVEPCLVNRIFEWNPVDAGVSLDLKIEYESILEEVKSVLYEVLTTESFILMDDFDAHVRTELKRAQRCQPIINLLLAMLEAKEYDAKSWRQKQPENKTKSIIFCGHKGQVCKRHRMMLRVLIDENAEKEFDWKLVGFQSDDPSTDFRGMGLLGLKQLIYFCEKETCTARHMILKAYSFHNGYPFAIVGINITAMIRDMLSDGRLKFYFYESKPAMTLHDFHDVYCKLFLLINTFFEK
ncbi:unnamed protein product [Soboliphyme baturini]|uniref:ELMO domain-containing protein n=1 Tax=Soboliphyme baturini TaxID=241478 RepID=A0A183IVG0_9BILA|nr:unnamed protein product [Soboliphyme baturini]